MATASDILVDALHSWGVDTIFGLPGDGINGLMEALRKREKDIRFVLVRHEEAAAFAACSYAKFTGRLGACIATSGPGAVHLLNGLYDAKLDMAPVVAVTGQTYSDLIGAHYQQEVNVLQLYSDVAVFNVQVNSRAHARLATDNACRTAIARRGVAHLNVPIDVQEEESKEKSHAMVTGATSEHPTAPVTHAPRSELEKAAAILAKAERVAILAGSGGRDARAQLLELAELLQAPIIKPLLGKDIVPDEHPHCLGGIGLLGTLPSSKAMEGCDALLMVGTSFPYMAFLPEPGSVPAVQVDIDAERIGIRYPVNVGLAGDARANLAELLLLLKAKITDAKDRKWLASLQDDMKKWWSMQETRATDTHMPMKPQVVAWELGKRLANDAIVCCDSGTIATWAARCIKMRGQQRFSLSGTLATMAPGLPYAIGAQVAYPGRQVVAFVGDGGLLMLGSELSTAAQHSLPVKVIVIKNGALGMIKWEQMAFLGNPSYGVTLPDVDFVRMAESMGVHGWRIEDPSKAGSVLEQALAHDGPALVECVVDPNEPPSPPHVTMEQALNMGKALSRGEPNAGRIALTLFRDKIRDFRGRHR